MNRYRTALRLADDDPNLPALAERFLSAVKEAEAEGQEPTVDPAVMLMGARIAFLTHADIGTNAMYRQLIDRCEACAQQLRAQNLGIRQ
jgi:hypothetical protein